MVLILEENEDFSLFEEQKEDQINQCGIILTN